MVDSLYLRIFVMMTKFHTTIVFLLHSLGFHLFAPRIAWLIPYSHPVRNYQLIIVIVEDRTSLVVWEIEDSFASFGKVYMSKARSFIKVAIHYIHKYGLGNLTTEADISTAPETRFTFIAREVELQYASCEMDHAPILQLKNQLLWPELPFNIVTNHVIETSIES